MVEIEKESEISIEIGPIHVKAKSTTGPEALSKALKESISVLIENQEEIDKLLQSISSIPRVHSKTEKTGDFVCSK